MAITREFREILAERVTNSSYKLIVKKVDFEVKLQDSCGTRFSVNKDQLNQITENEWPILNLRTRYVIRYNNNDDGLGNLNVAIVQKKPDNTENELLNFSFNSINGPSVCEIPFYLKYEE